MNSICQRLAALRQAMSQHSLAAYIVTNNDPHNSEYSADHWLARSWISGFTGSAGDAVITADGGGVWTDGRYYIQAEEQLTGSGLNLFKARQAETPTIAEWLTDTLPPGARVGVDGRTINVNVYQQLTLAFADKGIELVLEHDLIDPIWTDRPSRPDTRVFNYDLEYAGVETTDKLTAIRSWMTQRKSDALLVSTLDDVMWTLNIRGGDTLYCPQSEAYLLITTETCQLFIEPDKLPADVAATLLQQSVTAQPYSAVSETLATLGQGSRLTLNPASTDSLLISRIPKEIDVHGEPCPITDMKAQKNPVEMANMEKALVMDGVAVVRFMHWLEQQVPGGQVTELSAEAQLRAWRQQSPNYIGESFRTIAGFAAHGAKMHYAADAQSNVIVDESHFFLVDSGGQYLNGTTDITRTFHFGQPTEQQRRDYTLVLKAVIRLTQARFLQGSTGANLDVLARGVLWQHGIDYKCGTGHGVGVCLNVHEGPQNFSQNLKEVALKPGMVITNEPGVYREGEYGVRIENIMKVIEVERNAFGTFYGFDTITLAPIATAPLDTSLLDVHELSWLNHYHRGVYETLAPHLDTDEKQWLLSATQTIV